MPFVAYVHAGEPERPAGGRAAWEPNWRMWRWIIAAGLVAYGAAHTHGALAALLVVAVFALVCQAAGEAVPHGDGLREHRQ
jgi:hypothetical protein